MALQEIEQIILSAIGKVDNLDDLDMLESTIQAAIDCRKEELGEEES